MAEAMLNTGPSGLILEGLVGGLAGGASWQVGQGSSQAGSGIHGSHLTLQG